MNILVLCIILSVCLIEVYSRADPRDQKRNADRLRDELKDLKYNHERLLREGKTAEAKVVNDNIKTKVRQYSIEFSILIF